MEASNQMGTIFGNNDGATPADVEEIHPLYYEINRELAALGTGVEWDIDYEWLADISWFANRGVNCRERPASERERCNLGLPEGAMVHVELPDDGYMITEFYIPDENID